MRQLRYASSSPATEGGLSSSSSPSEPRDEFPGLSSSSSTRRAPGGVLSSTTDDDDDAAEEEDYLAAARRAVARAGAIPEEREALGATAEVPPRDDGGGLSPPQSADADALADWARAVLADGGAGDDESPADDDTAALSAAERLLRSLQEGSSASPSDGTATKSDASPDKSTSTEEDGLDDVLRRLEDLTASMRQRSLRFEPRGDLLLEQRRGLDTGLEPYGDGASDGGDDDPTSPDALLASFLGGDEKTDDALDALTPRNAGSCLLYTSPSPRD